MPTEVYQVMFHLKADGANVDIVNEFVREAIIDKAKEEHYPYFNNHHATSVVVRHGFGSIHKRIVKNPTKKLWDL